MQLALGPISVVAQLSAVIHFLLVFSATAAPATGPALPTVVLVPGAWHSPVHYSALIGLLKLSGYQTVSQRNPSVQSKNPNSVGVANDAAAIRDNLLLPQINAGKDVILAMHSYGGCPGSMAAKGLSKAERTAAGQKGGIVGLIFICAFVAKEGQSLLSQLPGQVFDPWVIQYGDGQLGVANPRNVFYNDVPAPIADAAIAAIRNQSAKALSTPSGPPAWADSVYDGRRAYFHTLIDNGIPPIAQELMIQASGVQWDIKPFNSSHAPFLSHPKELSAWMVAEIKRFTGGKPVRPTPLV